jgi:cyclopropane fatty-acyl-phospholipid synthase-like methyltransferase
MMTQEHINDRSNGYEAVAAKLMARRGQSNIGVATVRSWAASLPAGTSILDLGCGHGVPISAALMDDGFTVYGIDASPTLAAAFRRRFSQAEVACEAVEDSSFFERTFDGIIAVGLMFLLPPEAQRRLICRVAPALNPGGRFLFTAPTQPATWTDMLTGRKSLSLGDQAYKAALLEAGLVLLDEYVDEGENQYYDSVRQ